ncbi:hypothetical protein E2C01_078703 [Portunus trituberculatus]|uniref:Uncharacterized protein n=1 Tax=Portunus trituberculatus TaxID=210409 RepID=A0A5B7IPF2_PORTR|nr:hypothetical protein [Portunus trituberculatus]
MRPTEHVHDSSPTLPLLHHTPPHQNLSTGHCAVCSSSPNVLSPSFSPTSFSSYFSSSSSSSSSYRQVVVRRTGQAGPGVGNLCSRASKR